MAATHTQACGQYTSQAQYQLPCCDITYLWKTLGYALTVCLSLQECALRRADTRHRRQSVCVVRKERLLVVQQERRGSCTTPKPSNTPT